MYACVQERLVVDSPDLAQEYSNESVLLRFLRLRQKECRFPLDVVGVNWLGGGEMNRCLENANRMSRAGEVSLVSGWLALPYDKKSDCRQFTQHWWNYSHALDRCFDVTPNIDDGAVYVVDKDIAVFAFENRSRLESWVPASLLFRKGKFFRFHDAQGLRHVEPLETLATRNLFAPYLT